MQHQDLTPPAAPPLADRPALLQLGIVHPDARIDRDDGRLIRDEETAALHPLRALLRP